MAAGPEIATHAGDSRHRGPVHAGVQVEGDELSRDMRAIAGRVQEKRRGESAIRIARIRGNASSVSWSRGPSAQAQRAVGIRAITNAGSSAGRHVTCSHILSQDGTAKCLRLLLSS